jgi:xanthosine utilization system XapX-like protein
MVCTVAGTGATFAGVAAATLPVKAQKFWTAYAVASTGAYHVVRLAGVLLADAFLLSFELMIAFAFAGGFFQVFVEDLWEYRKHKNPLISRIVGIWGLLILVIVVYFVALLLDFAPQLWAQGAWFNEDDVLHIGMLLWVAYGYRVLRNRLQDNPDI